MPRKTSFSIIYCSHLTKQSYNYSPNTNNSQLPHPTSITELYRVEERGGGSTVNYTCTWHVYLNLHVRRVQFTPMGATAVMPQRYTCSPNCVAQQADVIQGVGRRCVASAGGVTRLPRANVQYTLGSNAIATPPSVRHLNCDACSLARGGLPGHMTLFITHNYTVGISFIQQERPAIQKERRKTGERGKQGC